MSIETEAGPKSKEFDVSTNFNVNSFSCPGIRKTASPVGPEVISKLKEISLVRKKEKRKKYRVEIQASTEGNSSSLNLEWSEN